MSDKDPFPLWSEPATKGDVIRAVVYTRACMIDTLIALRALRRNDISRVDEVLKDLSNSADELEVLVRDIAGTEND
ncbi:hypothetical protein [Sphingomonas montanisoli]|uniref:Uncharacterized protein n=1 Tax=Sphingomonas montanisoli TaxID=2606412 RepID=A0A5D9C2W4_9SPHN|nr:hypothetical protein [Sphingomonas montanisoli]TZG25612.1 hypothetical protein FYJ91_11340 [Sphingomonas montanisoli]